MLEHLTESWWFKSAMYAVLAAIGGALGYIMRTLDQKEKIIWWRALFEALGAAFVGFLVMLVCQEANIGQGYTGVVVGVCGWLGANVTIRLLESVVRKRLGISQGPMEVQDGVANTPGVGK